MSNITLALPSKGAIADPTNVFLKSCGLKVSKPNPRQYTGSIPNVEGVDVLFQRVKDIVYKVSDGTAHLGITGFDVVEENPHDDIIVIHEGLGYGHCKLVVAVPESWVDVQNMRDLAEIAFEFRQNEGRNLRIATTYTHSTRRFFHAAGIHHFSLLKAEGAIEAAPTIGYADIIVDLTQTGTTLRENHLKMLPDGIIIDSQACLIGNRKALASSAERVELTRILLEYIDAAVIGNEYEQLSVNIFGESAEAVANKVGLNPVTRGLLGPNVSPIYGALEPTNHGEQCFTITTTVRKNVLLQAVEYLRGIGGTQVVVSPVHHIFLSSSPTFSTLKEKLEGGLAELDHL